MDPLSSTITNQLKRKKIDGDLSPTHVNSSEQVFDVHWPRFLILESLDTQKQLSSLSPFVIEKAMKGIVGTVNDVKKMRTGSLLVEVQREAQSTQLLKQDSFAQVPVRVSPHRSMNSCKGVIRSFDLSKLDKEEILEELKSQGVTDVQNIMVNRNGHRQISPTLILTFNGSFLPNSIRAGYLKINVDLFIPNPLRCYNCQKFGHHKTTCSHQSLCAKCGLAAHGEEPCSRSAQCVNCHGDHPSYFTTCPTWLTEKQICRVKVTQNVSYPEARKSVVAISTSNQTVTYSNIVAPKKPQMKTIATQTDTTSCNCSKNQSNISKNNNNTSTKNSQAKTSKIQTHDKTSSTSTNNSRSLSVSPRRIESKAAAVEKAQLGKASGRLQKGSDNPIAVFNRFENMDMEDDPPDQAASEPLGQLSGSRGKRNKNSTPLQT